MPFSHKIFRFYWSAVRWAAALFLLFGQFTPVYAQGIHAQGIRAQDTGGIQVDANAAVLQPPQQVVFTLKAASPEIIDEVTIIHGFSGHGCDAEGTRVNLTITPGRLVQVRWVKDFALDGGFLPGVELWWQFEIHDKTGGKMLTDRQTLQLMDTNHRWNKLEEGSISLYWYEGSQPFGERLMGFAADSFKKLTEDAGVKSTGHIRILIYPSPEGMRDALGLYIDWAGGVAFGEYDLIIAAISPTDDIGWAQEVITHELTHVITENGFVNCQAVRLPIWLMEGIAEYTEGRTDSSEMDRIKKQLEDETLPKLKTFRYNFPVGEEEAHLAYVQSKLVVTYLIDTYGAEKMNRLVENIRTGRTIDQALRFIYGLNTDELDQTWRADMGYGVAPELNFVTETPAPTRTQIPTLDLHPSIWTPGPKPTRTVTAAPTVTVTLPPTAALPATRTPIPDGIVSHTPTAGLPQGQPTQTLWLLLAGGIVAAIGLVTGGGVWVIKKMK